MLLYDSSYRISDKSFSLSFFPLGRALWVAPVDFLIMIFTFLVTVLYNVEAGLEYGIIASVVILLLQIARLGMLLSSTFHFVLLSLH